MAGTRGELGPVQPPGDDPGLYCAIDPRTKQDFPTPVEDPNSVAVRDASRCSISGIHFQQPDLFHLLDGRNIGERAVQEIVSLAGEQFQRKGFGVIAVSRFGRRRKRSYGIQTLRLERVTVKLGLAANGLELALGER